MCAPPRIIGFPIYNIQCTEHKESQKIATIEKLRETFPPDFVVQGALLT